ncbi:MAG: hypothetical protein U0174_21860 [Polyangiaceae bacterium]
MKKALLVSAAICAGQFACAGDEGRVEDDLSGRVGATQLSTTESGIRLASGYDSLFDVKKNDCVKGVESRPPLVGQPTAQTTIKQIRSDSELSKELGIDVAVSVKVPTVSVQASTSLMKSYKNSATTLYYLIQATQSYAVSQNGDVALQNSALSDLSRRPSAFFTKCGDKFVSSITFQARIFAFVSFKTSSVERASSLQASISGSGNFGATAVDASVKSKLSRASKQSDVETTVRVITNGFDVSSSDPLLGVSGTLDDKLRRIDEVGGAMARSVAADRAKDTADYANNNSRSAIPVAIAVASYGIATNAREQFGAVFAKQQETLRKAETYIRTLSQLKHRMDRAYIDDISTFLGETDEGRAGYNLLPPALPVRFTSELGPIASAWASHFRPDDEDGVGTDIQLVSNAIARCVDSAKEGNYSNCGQTTSATSLSEYQLALASLKVYGATGRIGKLRFYVMKRGANQGYPAAYAACKDNSGWTDRLPTPDEAMRLAPLVASYGGGTDKTIWTGDAPSCAATRNEGLPTYSNPLDGRVNPSFGCKSMNGILSHREAVVCVPQSGPVGVRPEL